MLNFIKWSEKNSCVTALQQAPVYLIVMRGCGCVCVGGGGGGGRYACFKVCVKLPV